MRGWLPPDSRRRRSRRWWKRKQEGWFELIGAVGGEVDGVVEEGLTVGRLEDQAAVGVGEKRVGVDDADAGGSEGFYGLIEALAERAVGRRFEERRAAALADGGAGGGRGKQRRLGEEDDFTGVGLDGLDRQGEAVRLLLELVNPMAGQQDDGGFFLADGINVTFEER